MERHAKWEVDSSWAEAMRRADLQRAWKISDRSLQEYCRSGAIKHEGERHFQRIWRGEKLDGRRVLVRCYHGLGDTIQFVRFTKPLREIAREVVIWVQPELLDLLSGVEGVDALYPLHDGTFDASYDIDLEIMELAHVLRVTAELISSRVPYVPAHHSPVQPVGSLPISVGLLWEAGNWDRRRCVPPRALGLLHEIPGVRLFSLQQGAGRAMADMIPAQDLATSDLKSLAEIIMSLDLILTIDTMVAHLAGALGAQVWTMLHFDCDWRWPKSGRKSIWYPTMRLFHQPAAGDWDGLLKQVAFELKELTSRCHRDQAYPLPISNHRHTK
jgi:hypothetical protein